MRVAVTGASGHVGANLCRQLVAAGHQVHALVYRDVRALTGLPVKLHPGNVLEPDSLQRLCSDKIDVLFHTAAHISIRGDPDGLVERVNLEGTRNVIAACLANQVGRLVHFSSIDALQNEPHEQPLDENRALLSGSKSAYAKSKADAERAILKAVTEGLDAIILSPTSILGPFDFKPSLAGTMLLDMFRGHLPILVQGGFDWIDVRDVAIAAIKAATDGRSGERYLLSGKWASLSDVSRLAAAQAQIHFGATAMPKSLAWLGLPLVSAYCKVRGKAPLYTAESLRLVTESHRDIRHEKASRELGLTPRPLRKTVQDTHDWFQESGFLK